MLYLPDSYGDDLTVQIIRAEADMKIKYMSEMNQIESEGSDKQMQSSMHGDHPSHGDNSMVQTEVLS